MPKVISAFAGLAVLGAMLLPQFALAQAYSPNQAMQLQINLQTQSGTPPLSSAADVTVTAPNASLSGSSYGAGSVSYTTNFQNDTRVVTFTPGYYSVSVTPLSGYSYSFSPGCQGNAVLNNGSLICTIILSSGNSATGQLVVYTNVNSYSSFGGTLPSNFFLTINGNAPSPASVPVTNNSAGTSVALQPGYYSVQAPSLAGWQVSQLGDCQGIIQATESRECHINYSYGGGNYAYPYNAPLSCIPSYQQVAQGAAAQVTAVGGTGTYNWATAERNYQSIGAVLTTAFLGSGLQTVVVSSGSQTATCMVNVLAAGSIISAIPSGAYPPPSYPSYPSYPSLPNTGYAPQPSAPIAFALVAALALLITIAPYARAAFRTIR